MTASFSLNGKMIACGAAPYVIAEISGNHMGEIEKAFALIEAAHEAGADAVKFQTYEAETITLDCDAPNFVVQEKLWQGQRLFDLYKKAQTPFAWHKDLFAKANDVGITAFSAPFDNTALDLLESLSCPFYKIASCELVDIPLLEKVGATGKPVIISTGMATKEEITEAVDTLKKAGAIAIAILHCISGYPTPLENANIDTIRDLRETFDIPIGISDHSHGTIVPIAATASGVAIIEKHICLADTPNAVDSDFSLDPAAFAEMVNAVKNTHRAMGIPTYGPTEAEADSLRFRRSLYICKDMKAGDILCENSVRSVRPAGGLHTRYLSTVIGKKLLSDITAGTPLTWEVVEGGVETKGPCNA